MSETNTNDTTLTVQEDQEIQFEDESYGSITASLISPQPGTITCPIVLLTILSAIGGFLFGYDTGVISGAMLALKEVFHLSYLWQELIVSVTIGAAAVAALCAGPLNDVLGRRMVILISSFVFTAGAIIMGATNSKELLLVGRLVVGLGIGLASMTVPMYISECAPARLRGKLTVINNLFITGGQMFASVLDGLLFTDRENGWRYMLGLAGVPSLIQFIGFLFMPESPRWLVTKGRDDQAMDVLAKLYGTADNVAEEVQSIQQSYVESKRGSHGGAFETTLEEDEIPLIENDDNPAFGIKGENSLVILQILRDPPARRALILGCGLQIFQQLGGINTVMYYSATIVQMAGVHDPQTAVWVAAGIAGVNFVFTIVGLILVDRLGRRRLTLGSQFGVIVSLGLLAAAFQVTAMTSPSTELHPSPPANISSNCYLKTRCSDCVNRQDCGFCFSEPASSSGSLATNGSCLPTRVGFGEKSLYGPCVDPTTTDHHWAYDYCPSPYSWLAILGMVLYLMSFAPGMGPMPWTVNSEIFPTWARSTGVAISTGCNWIFNLIIAMTFLTLTEAITRYGTFWLYTAIAILGFVFLAITLPETRGKTLEQIEMLFHRPWTLKCWRW